MRIHAKYFSIGIAALTAISSLTAGVGRLRGEEPLRWKFEVGEKLDYNMVQEMNMSAAGEQAGQMNTTMRQEMDMTWDVQGVDKKTGEAVIKQKFDRVKLKMSTPVGGFEYDSKSEAAPTGLGAMIAPMYKAMTQGEFEITMTSRGEVKDVKIPEEVITALKSSPGAAAMGDIATADGFKKMISQGALVLPEKAPKLGETWATKVEMNNPAVGKQSVVTIYRYDGTKEIDGKTFAVIKPHLKMEFESQDEAAKSTGWTEVLTFKGKGTKKSPAFDLTGGEARLRFKYNGDAGKGTGMFSAYVLDEGQDAAKAGGFPEAMTSAESDESATSLQKGAGRYFLNIVAAGDWDVTVEEAKPAPKPEPPKADQSPQPQKPPQPPQVQMRIAEQSSDGEVLFNIENGRLYSTSLTQKVTIDANVNGQPIKQKIDQKIDVKVAPSGEKKAEEAKKPEASEEKAKK